MQYLEKLIASPIDRGTVPPRAPFQIIRDPTMSFSRYSSLALLHAQLRCEQLFSLAFTPRLFGAFHPLSTFEDRGWVLGELGAWRYRTTWNLRHRARYNVTLWTLQLHTLQICVPAWATLQYSLGLNYHSIVQYC